MKNALEIAENAFEIIKNALEIDKNAIEINKNTLREINSINSNYITSLVNHQPHTPSQEEFDSFLNISPTFSAVNR